MKERSRGDGGGTEKGTGTETEAGTVTGTGTEIERGTERTAGREGGKGQGQGQGQDQRIEEGRGQGLGRDKEERGTRTEEGQRQRQRQRRQEERRANQGEGRGPRSRDRDRDRDRRGRDQPRKRDEDGGQDVLTGANADEEEKQGPDFAVSGKLLEDTNVFNGVVVKYAEPPEARKCKKRWRFYVFKGDDVVSTLHMHRQSAYLIGKDRKVADLPVDHPSCSRQHAVLQYRSVKGRGVLPYVMDLGSSNGTYLNNNRIESKRYYELREKDMLKFGYSSREYVLLHEHSQDQDGQSD